MRCYYDKQRKLAYCQNLRESKTKGKDFHAPYFRNQIYTSHQLFHDFAPILQCIQFTESHFNFQTVEVQSQAQIIDVVCVCVCARGPQLKLSGKNNTCSCQIWTTPSRSNFQSQMYSGSIMQGNIYFPYMKFLGVILSMSLHRQLLCCQRAQAIR